jgi:dCMP deaminase
MSYNWNKYFLDMCAFVATKSKDKSTKVGSVIVGQSNEIRSTGYNGFPRGVDDSIESRHERPDKYLWTIHAEQNAILAAAKMGTSLENCRIYVDLHPCSRCAGFIIQSGISEVIIDERNIEQKKGVYERLKNDIDVARIMFKEANMKMTYFKEK